MKTTRFFSTTFLLVLAFQISWGQVPTIKAKSNKASVRVGKKLYKDAWPMEAKPQSDPDNIGSEVENTGTIMGVITDSDSLSFMVKPGQTSPFRVIINQKDTVWAAFKGRFSKANFDAAYRKANDNKTLVEVPKFYELVNIVMAITPTGQRDSVMIEHENAYYNQVQAYFGKHKNHRAVVLMDSLLRADQYFNIKMDAYSFEFDQKGTLQQKTAYNRISWGSDNTIAPYVSVLQDFAKKADFQVFYQKNKPFYTRMVQAYQDSLGVPAMQVWLNRNFPATRYNCFKIIFSPLVSGNQSATDFESNGFKEGQPHVNFPDFWYNPKTSKVSEKSVNVQRGNIVFTELNHLFENPEFENERNSAAFNAFDFNLAVYADKTKAAGSYGNPLSCVEEYMNWGLVSLRYVDTAPQADWEVLFSQLDNRITNYRGFRKFKEFNRFLIDLYLKRQKNQVIADLYPQIIAWFKTNNQ